MTTPFFLARIAGKPLSYPEYFTRERDDRAGIGVQVRICNGGRSQIPPKLLQ